MKPGGATAIEVRDALQIVDSDASAEERLAVIEAALRTAYSRGQADATEHAKGLVCDACGGKRLVFKRSRVQP